MIDDQEMRAIAFLATRCRPTGARQWSPDAVMAEVAKLRGRSLSSVALAVLRAAADRGCERPEVIGSGGSHWNDTMLPRDFVPNAAPVGTRCTVCGGVKDGPHTGHAYSRPRESDPNEWVEGVTKLRAELAPTSPPPVPLTPDDFAAKNPELHQRLQQVRANLIPDAVTREPEETP